MDAVFSGRPAFGTLTLSLALLATAAAPAAEPAKPLAAKTEPTTATTATAAATTATATAPGRNLLAAEPQNNWLHAQAQAAGWKLSGDKLTGDAKSKPLQSNLALGDFQLHIDWIVADGAVIQLGLPKASAMPPAAQPASTTPIIEGAQINLAEKPGIAIRLPQGAKILKVNPSLRGKLHHTVIKRVGDQLIIDCDTSFSRELPIDTTDKLGLSLAITGATGGKATIESLRLVDETKPDLTKSP